MKGDAVRVLAEAVVPQARTIEQRLGIAHALLRLGRRGLGRGLALLERQGLLRRHALARRASVGGSMRVQPSRKNASPSVVVRSRPCDSQTSLAASRRCWARSARRLKRRISSSDGAAALPSYMSNSKINCLRRWSGLMPWLWLAARSTWWHRLRVLGVFIGLTLLCAGFPHNQHTSQTPVCQDGPHLTGSDFEPLRADNHEYETEHVRRAAGRARYQARDHLKRANEINGKKFTTASWKRFKKLLAAEGCQLQWNAKAKKFSVIGDWTRVKAPQMDPRKRELLAMLRVDVSRLGSPFVEGIGPQLDRWDKELARAGSRSHRANAGASAAAAHGQDVLPMPQSVRTCGSRSHDLAVHVLS